MGFDVTVLDEGHGLDDVGIQGTHLITFYFYVHTIDTYDVCNKGSRIRIETYFPWLINLDSNPSQPGQDLLSILEKIYMYSSISSLFLMKQETYKDKNVYVFKVEFPVFQELPQVPTPLGTLYYSQVSQIFPMSLKYSS